MTGDLRESRDAARILGSVKRIKPSEDATRQALRRATETVQRIEGHARRPIMWKGLFMRTGIAAAILIAVGVVVWLNLDSSPALAGPTWEDLKRQTAGITTAHLDMRSFKDGELVEHAEVWIQSPGTIRTLEYEEVDGQWIPAEGAIATPDAAVRWSEKTRQAEYAATDNPYMAQSAVARTYEAVLGISLLAEQPEADVKINGEQVEFVPAREAHPEDATLRGFRLQTKAATGPALPELFGKLIYWFDARSNTLRRISATGDENRRADAKVELNPQLQAGWFDVDIPEGLFDVKAGVRPRLSPELAKVYDQVAAARQRFGDYKAVIWRDRAGGWPTHREAARGEAWRCDMIDWTVMHGAMDPGPNTRGYARISPDDSFEKVWEQATRQDYELEMSAMAWQGRYAVVHYNLAGRGPRVSAKLFDHLGMAGYEGPMFGPALRFVAWPEWISWENLHPHGWSISESPLQWRLAPAETEHPELVEVIGQRDSGDLNLVRYIFDRRRDWLCIRQELQHAKHTDVVTLEDVAHAEDGFWYPRRIAVSASGATHTYDYSIQRGAAEVSFFVWPEGVPEPTDVFAGLRSPTSASAASQDLTETAKGKYTTIGTRGLPRGFADQATAEAHRQMVDYMGRIESALDDYAYKHEWVFPASLEELVDEGYLDAKYLTNPLHPDAKEAFGYIRPQFKLPNRLERMVLFEPFDEWPGVVTVMFQDGSSEHIHDQAEFQKLLREATSPEPPSWPDEE